MSRRVGFARWRSDLPSGGNRYDDALSAGLRALGFDVREHDVSGPWPVPGDTDRARLVEVLGAEQDWMLGNIVASAAPDILRDAVEGGRRVTLLLHYFPADDPALSEADRERLAETEADAVRAASSIVVTSEWAAAQVSQRYGRDDAVVAVPGVGPAEPAPGSSPQGLPPALLWLARLTPTKDPLTLVEALARMQDLDWTARLVGPDTIDRPLTRKVHRRIDEAGLADRVEVLGSRSGDALETIWARTDLLVHTSRAETYGMVVTEALAHGIPAIVPEGTGAVEALRVGATFPPGDADILARVLRTWLTERRLRAHWRTQAADARAQLPTWRDTARIVGSTLVG